MFSVVVYIERNHVTAKSATACEVPESLRSYKSASRLPTACRRNCGAVRCITSLYVMMETTR